MNYRMFKFSRLTQVKQRTLFTVVSLFLSGIFLIYYVFIYDDFSFETYKCKNQKNRLPSTSIDDTKTNLIKECKNKVEFQNKIAVWSMLSDDQYKYAVGAIKLLKSIQINAKQTSFDAIILELINKPILDDVKEALLHAGWQICQVERIPPRNERNTLKRFRDQFTKLLLWRIDEYEANYYFDSDTLAIGNLDEFFKLHAHLDKKDHQIGCGQDFRDKKWVNTFNLGVFIVKPDLKEYERLIRFKDDASFKYETIMSEQGFLNAVYKHNWLNIGFKNNANLALYFYLPSYWLENQQRINIIHYTMSKPWSCSESYKDICNLWKNLDHCI